MCGPEAYDLVPDLMICAKTLTPSFMPTFALLVGEDTREDGSVIEPNDPFWDTLQAAAIAARDRPRVWLEQRQFYGDLVEAPRFAKAFERWLDGIWSDGCEAALHTYTSA